MIEKEFLSTCIFFYRISFFQAVLEPLGAYLTIKATGKCISDPPANIALENCTSICVDGDCDEALRCCKHEALTAAIKYFDSSNPEGRDLEV